MWLGLPYQECSWEIETGSQIHIKKFHYFNNSKACPYDELCCMFAYKVSSKCRFSESCSKPLCSFQHSEEVVAKDIIDDETMDEEINETQFYLCMVNLPNRDDLMDHYELDHLQFYTLMTSRSNSSWWSLVTWCPTCPLLAGSLYFTI